ncbi:hypothetical protein LguiA_008182 [Lonicera macranthoides]
MFLMALYAEHLSPFSRGQLGCGATVYIQGLFRAHKSSEPNLFLIFWERGSQPSPPLTSSPSSRGQPKV